MNRSVAVLFFLFSWILTGCNVQDHKQGEILYQSYCSDCHMSDGTGLGSLYPPLADSDYYRDNINKVPCIIMDGLADTIVVNGIEYSEPMKALEGLTHTEISNIISYINHKWYPELEMPNPLEIKKLVSECKNYE